MPSGIYGLTSGTWIATGPEDKAIIVYKLWWGMTFLNHEHTEKKKQNLMGQIRIFSHLRTWKKANNFAESWYLGYNILFYKKEKFIWYTMSKQFT